MTNDLRSRLLNEDHNYHEAACHEAWAKIEALTAERDARIDPAEVQALVNAAEPMLAEALAAAEAERDRMREALQQFLIEYDEVDLADAEPSSLTEAVLAARAALKGETP